MEKRNYERVHFKAEAITEFEGRSIRGEVENLSMRGMFLRVRNLIPVQVPLTIRVILSGASSFVSITIHGSAVRKDAEGVGIEFSGMDLDSFILLKNIVEQNLTNPQGTLAPL